MAYIAYSTASANIIGHADTIEAARQIFSQYDGNDEFLVILECPTSEAEKLNSWDIPRRNMRVVWRGSNDLAQRFFTNKAPA